MLACIHGCVGLDDIKLCITIIVAVNMSVIDIIVISAELTVLQALKL